MELLSPSELPHGWRYPPAFLRLVDRGLTFLEPWYLLSGPQLRRELTLLRAGYPSRRLVPFARREDSDDVACWEPDPVHGSDRVLILRSTGGDRATQSYGDGRAEALPNFSAWVLRAVLDMVVYDAGIESLSSAH